MITQSDMKWLDRARSLACLSNERMKHGAIVVRSGKSVGRGINKSRNDSNIVSPEHIKTDCSYHAEAIAIRKAGGRSTNGVIYVARVSNDGYDRNSEPCLRCKQIIKNAGIKRIVYTTTGEE